jgi:hypothetical protein
VTKRLLVAGGRRNVEFEVRIEYKKLLKSHLRVEETCGKGGESSVVVRMMHCSDNPGIEINDVDAS